MAIDNEILPALANEAFFADAFVAYSEETLGMARLKPLFSLSRIRDAHLAWREDIARVQAAEPNLHDGMDHLKQCGHLGYWLRRMSPIVEYQDTLIRVEDDPEPYPDEAKFRQTLEGYGSEYLAFDFGFQICMAYEETKVGRVEPYRLPPITEEYIRDTCHMLKFKHVSPHSMFLIYRSLFV